MTELPPAGQAKSWPDYRAVWRWHFYASLFCLPFVMVLSITGAIYLFKPQIDAFGERAYNNLTFHKPAASAADQVRAVLAAYPQATFASYELPENATDAGRVIVRQQGQALRVYVHPETLAIMHAIPEDERFTRWIFRLHGELLVGDRGSNLVELAASWTIIMILTGLFLWWPRGAKTWGGIVYPRFWRGSKIFWRDIHSVAGVWISCLALFLLLTGLPWAKFWGEYFKTVRRLTGTAVARQDWSTGGERSRGARQSGGDHSGHGEHGGHAAARVPADLTALDRVIATVRPLNLPPPVVIAPPADPAEQWSAKSLTQNRPKRVNLELSGTTGAIVKRQDFRDRHWVDRVVGTGIAAHEGQWFGWANQALGLMTAAGLNLLCVSGVVMWWRRRDQGVLGAPKALARPRFSWGLLLIIVLLALYLPLFGVSLLIVGLLERLVLRRIPRIRDWLGLGTEPVLVRPVTNDEPAVLNV